MCEFGRQTTEGGTTICYMRVSPAIIKALIAILETSKVSHTETASLIAELKKELE